MSHINGAPISGSSLLENGNVTFTSASAGALTLGNCYNYSTQNSVLVGVTNSDPITPQTGQVCAPQVIIQPPAALQVIEGQELALEFLTASGLNLNSVSNGTVRLNARELGFNWYYTYWSRNRKVTIPHYSLETPAEIGDAGFVSLQLSGSLNGESLSIGNELNLQVFIPEADFDLDGLSNAVEVRYAGLDPTNSDSDGDGILDALDDLDHDGLINRDELANNTLLDNADTDGDNLSDGNEVNVYRSNPNLYDTDGDGLSDGFEANSSPASDPTLRDTDADGIDDNIEVQYGLNPASAADAAADADNDGLSNLDEVLNNTRIDRADTDGDTLSDGDEVHAIPATNPLSRDTDNDGLNDNEDYDPVVADSEMPQVTLTAPDLTQTYLQGQRLTFNINAQDQGRVTQVLYRINNVQQPTILTSAPYQVSIVLPTNADSLVFEALAIDTNGNQGSTGPLTVNIIADPLTTVVGTVLDNNALPIEGVLLTVNNLQAVSQADGSFVINNVPVAPGDVTVLANIVINGVTFIGGSNSIAPVRAGVTNVGQIQLIQDQVTVGYFNNRYGSGQTYQRFIIERAGMEAVQITNLATFDLSTVDMLMVDFNNYYTCTNGQYYPNRQRVFDWVAAGGTLIFHEDRYYSNFCSGYNSLLPRVPGSYSTNFNSYAIYPENSANEFASGSGGEFNGFYQSSQVLGSVQQSSLIAEATPLVFNGTPDQGYIVGLDYPWQQGRVYYSTIRLESISTNSATHTLYAPNMLSGMFTRSLPDSDGDGLPDRMEIINGTNITLADTDGDGMNDAYEVRYHFNPLLDDATAALDSDNDGASNLLESQYGSNPNRTDSDQDGLMDGAEILHALPSDPTRIDSDLDRLNDNQERSYGTDPKNRDTDGDTISDGDEIYNYGSNPLLFDSDGDGLGDALEINNGLNPSYGGDAYSDNDGDGLSNRDELLIHGTNYNNPDGDNDGLNDGQEIAAGSNPFDADSDDDGILDGNDAEVLIADTVAPVIQLISHANSLNAVTGETIRFVFEVTDNGQIGSVSMATSLNGGALASTTQQPYQLAFTVDGLSNVYTLYFSARDVSGNATTIGPVTINRIADPLTQITGRIVDELGRPIQGAEISYAGSIAEYSDSTGQFNIDAVSTVINPLALNISAQFGLQRVSTAIEASLIRSGITDLGTIELRDDSSSSLGGHATVGYYHLSYNAGINSQVAAIVAAGLDAVNIGDMNTADLTQFDILFVETNGGYQNNFFNNLPKIHEFIHNGGVLILHDWGASAASVLPGSPATYVYNPSNDTQLLISDPAFTNGPGGVIDNTTLDFGNNSSHGYVDANSVPADAVGLLSKTNTSQWVTYAYPYGAGNVIYSTIPLNHYLSGNGSAAFRDIYAPNLLNYASTLLMVDTDQDGVSDYDEVIAGTDYRLVDTDGDGLQDGFEIRFGFDPLVSGEQLLDSDADGLSNLEEQLNGSNPLLIDTDGDSLSDADEVNLHHSDPLSSDGDHDGINDVTEIGLGTNPLSADSDADGVDDYAELFSYNTNPLNSDSDGDGMSDGFEVQYGMQNSDASADNDNDGLSNAQESAAGTSPYSVDTDGDRLSDYAEYLLYGSDPSLPDTDAGGRRDSDEILLDTTDVTLDDDLTSITDTYSYLQNQSGNSWQIRDAYGFVTDGSLFSNGFRLYVNNSAYTADYINGYYATGSAGQELFFNIQSLSGLLVGRRVYVPTAGTEFIRYLEVLHNPGTTPITTTVRNDVYYYSGNPDVVTQSGGSQLSSNDQYLLISDLNNINQPVVAHVFAGPNAETGISSNSTAADGSQSWNITQQFEIPPGETRYVLHFVGKYGSTQDAQTNIQTIRTLGGNALANLSDDIRSRIVNFYAYQDTDFDGLTDAQESALGTLLDNPDSDEDGVSDSVEVLLGTNPLLSGDQLSTTISGRVINSVGSGIANVTVLLDSGHQTLTDSNGQYSFPSVLIDRQHLSLTATLDINGEIISASSAQITLNLAGETVVDNLLLSYQSAAGSAEDITLANSGVRLSLSDDSYQQIGFSNGFTFNFFGVNYSNVFIGSNGSLTFGSGSASYSNGVPGDLVQGLPRISPLFGDLNPSSGGSVYYQQTANSFSATWLALREYGSSNVHTFRVTLFANGQYLIQYGDMTTTSGRRFGVGVTPGGAAVYESVDFSEAAGTAPTGPAIYEVFNSMPSFDLENQLIVFKPEAGRYRIYRNLCDDTDQDGLCDIEEVLIGSVIGNQDSDGDGILDGNDPNPVLFDSTGPQIELLSPAPGRTLVRSSAIPLELHIADSGGLAEVRLNVDNSEFIYSYSAEQSVQVNLSYSVPLTAETVSISVSATDLSGNISNYGPELFSAIDDPKTTVSGTVSYQYGSVTSPIAGFNVTLQLTGSGETFSTTTDRNGVFSIADVPTIYGDVRAQVSGNIAGYSQTLYTGYAAAIANGVTELSNLSFNYYIWSYDFDSDGLLNILENNAGTDSYNADTDGDLLSDNFEVLNSFDPLIVSLEAYALDTDNDGLTNQQEIDAGTNPGVADGDQDNLSDSHEINISFTDPANADTDNDGLTDDFELSLGTDPRNRDSDLDNVNDRQEIDNGLNPLLSDSDSDGMSDGFEYNYGLLNSPATDDNDNDGLTNLAEYLAGTSPVNVDTDYDGLTDHAEVVKYGTSALNADSDSDNFYDVTELFVYHTDPGLLDNIFSDEYRYNDAVLNPGLSEGPGLAILSPQIFNISYYAFNFGPMNAYVDRSGLLENLKSSNGQYLGYTGQLYVNNNRYAPNDQLLQMTDIGQVYLGAATWTDSTVAYQRYYTGEDFVRILHIIENTSEQSLQTEIAIRSGYGGSNRDIRVHTSDGNEILQTGDDYIIVGNPYAAALDQGYIVHVFASGAATQSITSDSYGYNGRSDWQTSYRINMAPNSKRIIMHLIATADTLEQAQIIAAQLPLDSAKTWAGMSDADSALVVNMQPVSQINAALNLLVPSLSTYQEGDSILLAASATLVDSVDFYINGIKQSSSSAEPHIYALKLPRVANAGSSLTFQVKGTAAGVAIQSASQIVNLSERPKADITGRVMLEQNGVSEAVSGARVTLDRQSYSVLTDAAGYFTLSSVFIDDALEIKVSHELRGESLVWEQRALPQVNAGIVDVGNLLFHDDDVTTLYDESTGNELQFKPNNTEYRYYPSMDFSFHGYPVDYISIRKDYGYLSLYDRNGYAIQYINALPVNQFSFQKMAGIRVHESEGYLAITYDSVAIDGVANSAMTMQLQFQSTGNVKILYGSTAIDLRNYMNGYLDFQFRGNDSGNYESANLDFSALTSADPYIIKPYKRFSLNEYFYSSAAFDLMGNVVEFDYDFSSGFRIWSEPLTSIPVPLQYLQ